MATIAPLPSIPRQTRPRPEYMEAAEIFLGVLPGLTGDSLRERHPGSPVVTELAEAVDALAATG